MDMKKWLKGLGLAVAGAAVAGAANVLNNRLQNGPNAAPVTGSSVGLSAAAGAIIAAVGYLVQSPITPAQPPQLQ